MRTLLIIIILGSALKMHSQNIDYAKKSIEALLINDIKIANIENAKNKTKSKILIQWHIDSFIEGVNDTLVNHSSAITKNSPIIEILSLTKDASIYHMHYFQSDSLIYANLKKTLEISKKTNDTTLIRFSYHKILRHLLSNVELLDLVDNYAEDYKNYSKTIQDEALYTYYKYTAKMYLLNAPQTEKYKEVLEKFKQSNDYLTRGILNQIIGINETYFHKNHDLAIKYFNKAISNYNKVNGYTSKSLLYKTNNNLGYVYRSLGDFNKALEFYHKKPSISFGKNNLYFESQQYYSMSLVFKDAKNLDSTFYYSEKEKEVLEKYRDHESAIKQREIETKYQTVEKEKLLLQKENELLIEQKKKKQNRDLFITSLIVLLFGGITAILFQKNTKRKQLLAEQEKELQTQKVTTLLKEQELTSIDAMIEGQEKERQTIANDLHDDLGGLMATVKLHFDALQKKQSPDLFTKTNNLLDEAYQKIRGIAHAKNSGVLASQGLLKAIKNMAKKVSNANSLQIEIIDHGLESRLENSLELTIFRIIQELITNVIKHAHATEVTIQLTNHDHKLNIVVEDNGKGFNTKKLNKVSGMGIHSIDKRIENLNGTVVIDSKIGKGTTVIIDIPT